MALLGVIERHRHMARSRMEVRVGLAGNGIPVFLIAGQTFDHQRIFGATWDAERALWMYPAFLPASDKVLADLEVLSGEVDVSMSDVARRHVEGLARSRDALTGGRLPAGFDFVTKPHAHQLEGLCHVFYYPRAALYFDPGTGKSKIAIDLVRLLRHGGAHGCALVLGPRITVENWGREVDKHSGRQLSWVAVTGTREQKLAAVERAAAERADVVLVTYDTAKRIVDSLVQRLDFELLVLDESHNCKAWSSERTKAAWEIAQKARRRVLMTGSPTEGDPRDVYAPYKILGDCFMPEPYYKYERMVTKRPTPRSHLVTGYKNLDLVNARTTFLSLRKTKEECLDLPARTFVDVDYSLSHSQEVLYDQIVETMGISIDELQAFALGIRDDPQAARALLPKLLDLPAEMVMPHRAAALLKLLQITSGFVINNVVDENFCDTARGGQPCEHIQDCVAAEVKPHTKRCKVIQKPWPTEAVFSDHNPKHDAIMELVDGIVSVPSAKVIVWCVFHPEMDSIVRRLTAVGVGHVRVDGDTRHPMTMVDKFNEDSNTRVYVGQVASGIGINLVAATYAIYSSLPYSLTQYSQSLDRNYRIGQDQPVTVYRMIGRRTLEALVAHLLDHKVDVDALLTNKIECALCPHSVKCLAAGIEPFQTGCIHPRTVARPVIKARTLQRGVP
jgi:SNF2 family DNA or RNA helicase